MDKKECCGTCKHCEKQWDTNEWVCTEPRSEYYSFETEYNEHCDEYESRH